MESVKFAVSVFSIFLGGGLLIIYTSPGETEEVTQVSQQQTPVAMTLSDKPADTAEVQVLLLLLGGWTRPFQSVAEVVGPAGGCRPPLPPLPRLQFYPSVGRLGNVLLACGADYNSYNDSRYACWSLRLDAADPAWTALPRPRRSHRLFLSAAAATDHKFWLIGGSQSCPDNWDCPSQRIVQFFDPSRPGAWHPGPRLPFPVFEGCAAGAGGAVYMVGDFRGNRTNVYRLAEDGDRWVAMPRTRHEHPMPGCAVVRIGGSPALLVVSGRRAEFLDLEEPTAGWAVLPDLNYDRGDGPSVGMSQGRLVVAGGHDGEYGYEATDAIEVWDEAAGAWDLAAAKMLNGRSKHGTVELTVSANSTINCF